MLDTFQARLEARDPEKGHFRSYRVEAGTDLFGAWLVDITYGRIGTGGRQLRYVTDNAHEARLLVKQTLRRRSTAKKRIGTSYRLIQLHDPHGWFRLEI